MQHPHTRNLTKTKHDTQQHERTQQQMPGRPASRSPHGREGRGTAPHSAATARHHTSVVRSVVSLSVPFFFIGMCTAENGTASHSTATHGITHSKATHGNTWHGNKHHSGTQHSNTRHGAARHQTSRDCHSTRLPRHGTARHETATA